MPITLIKVLCTGRDTAADEPSFAFTRIFPVPNGDAHEDPFDETILPTTASASSPAAMPDPPIFSELASRWALTNRAVPGRADMEWAALAAAPRWPLW
jgi:hypothetical protein